MFLKTASLLLLVMLLHHCIAHPHPRLPLSQMYTHLADTELQRNHRPAGIESQTPNLPHPLAHTMGFWTCSKGAWCSVFACNRYTCPNHPDALCLPDICNNCQPIWLTRAEGEVTDDC